VDACPNTTFHNITNGSYPESITVGFNGTPFGVWKENNTIRSIFSLGGAQIWKLRTNDITVPSPSEAGYISYSTPGGSPGIIFYNSTFGQRENIYMTANGLKFESSSTGSSNSNGVLVNNTGNLELTGVSKGITMVSPNGNKWCTTVSNVGLLTTTAGACT